jgi:acyl-CoA thioesterase-1
MAFKSSPRALAGAALAFVCLATSATAEPYKIVGFGDSLMAGYGLDAGQSFPEKLEQAMRAKGHDVVIVNAGVSGDTSSGGLARLDWSVPEDADLVVLELGANDMLRGVPPQITERNLDTMITRLKQRPVAVLLAGMRAAPNLGPEYRAAFDAIYPRLSEKHAAPLYGFFLDGVAADPRYLLDERMHPNAAGIDRMVERFVPHLEAVIAATPAGSAP